MSETVLYCPLCKSEHSRPFDSRSFRGNPVVNRICQDCGLVFQSPRMTEAESAAFYADEYRLLNEGSIDPTARNMAAQQARAAQLKYRPDQPVELTDLWAAVFSPSMLPGIWMSAVPWESFCSVLRRSSIASRLGSNQVKRTVPAPTKTV